MINRIVIGASAKQYRKEHGIVKGKSIRPYLAQEQIKEVKALQRMDIGLVIAVPDFQERKRILRNQFQRRKLIA